MNFDSLGLSETLLKAVSEQGYTTPSPIQEQAIPAVLTGRDVMAAAQTGTGKTAGFTLPLLQLLSQGSRPKANQARALVLTPTRELAAQVSESVENYGKHQDVRSAVVFGGVNINPQMIRLRKGVDVLVATPGRLLDLYEKNAVRFDHLEILVLDEADRMLDMGFIRDIKRILALLPKRRQNLMFSATFSDDIRQLAKGLVHDPIEVSVAAKNTTAETITQSVVPIDKARKPDVLVKLIKDNNWFQVLVFTRTKHGANRLAQKLEKSGITAAAIHGNKSQGARTRALANFKSSDIQVLVATDIAARGLDIDQLPHVVNFELPNVSEDYVHRIGRTGRAGLKGEALSLVCAEEYKDLIGIERLIQKHLPRKTIEGFEPKVPLPNSPNELRPTKAKKPKKPKSNNQGASGSSSSSGKSGNSSDPWKAKPKQGSRSGNSVNTNRSDSNRDSKPSASGAQVRSDGDAQKPRRRPRRRNPQPNS
jgi:ATP-dependent RNA helicase RhlE